MTFLSCPYLTWPLYDLRFHDFSQTRLLQKFMGKKFVCIILLIYAEQAPQVHVTSNFHWLNGEGMLLTEPQKNESYFKTRFIATGAFFKTKTSQSFVPLGEGGGAAGGCYLGGSHDPQSLTSKSCHLNFNHVQVGKLGPGRVPPWPPKVKIVKNWFRLGPRVKNRRSLWPLRVPGACFWGKIIAAFFDIFWPILKQNINA